MLQHFDALIQQAGNWGYLAFAMAAMIEYLFPPFPGDTVVLLGGAYASRGGHPWQWVLSAVVAASLVGMAVDHWVGSRLGSWLEKTHREKFWFGITKAHLNEAADRLRRRGNWVLVINRFFPSFRSIVFFASGAAKIPLTRVLLLGGLSAALWNALLLAVGMTVGANAEKLQTWIATYQRWALAAVAILLFGWLARYALKQRASNRTP